MYKPQTEYFLLKFFNNSFVVNGQSEHKQLFGLHDIKSLENFLSCSKHGCKLIPHKNSIFISFMIMLIFSKKSFITWILFFTMKV
jgi:hypothetical protein